MFLKKRDPGKVFYCQNFSFARNSVESNPVSGSVTPPDKKKGLGENLMEKYINSTKEEIKRLKKEMIGDFQKSSQRNNLKKSNMKNKNENDIKYHKNNENIKRKTLRETIQEKFSNKSKSVKSRRSEKTVEEMDEEESDFIERLKEEVQKPKLIPQKRRSTGYRVNKNENQRSRHKSESRNQSILFIFTNLKEFKSYLRIIYNISK